MGSNSSPFRYIITFTSAALNQDQILQYVLLSGSKRSDGTAYTFQDTFWHQGTSPVTYETGKTIEWRFSHQTYFQLYAYDSESNRYIYSMKVWIDFQDPLHPCRINVLQKLTQVLGYPIYGTIGLL